MNGTQFPAAANTDILFPPGAIPLYRLRGGDMGGDAANVRLNELKRPEEEQKKAHGIPIEKIPFAFTLFGEKHSVIGYRLAMTRDQARSFIDLENCRMKKSVVELWGLELYETTDGAGSADGKVVRLRPKTKLGQAGLFATL
jgi:hypothetical protein